MPHQDSKSFYSRSLSKKKYKASKKIYKRNTHQRLPQPRNRVARRRKANYSPEYNPKPNQRLCYSQEHKPKIEQQQTEQSYSSFIDKQIAKKLKRDLQQGRDIIEKIAQISI